MLGLTIFAGLVDFGNSPKFWGVTLDLDLVQIVHMRGGGTELKFYCGVLIDYISKALQIITVFLLLTLFYRSALQKLKQSTLIKISIRYALICRNLIHKNSCKFISKKKIKDKMVILCNKDEILYKFYDSSIFIIYQSVDDLNTSVEFYIFPDHSSITNSSCLLVQITVRFLTYIVQGIEVEDGDI